MNWNAKPPERNTRESVVRLVRVPAGADWRVICTATRLATVEVHFLDGRTMPCRRADQECQACRMGLSRKFEAYMGAWNVSRQVDQVITLPHLAYEQLAAGVGELLDGKLRGLWFQLTRPGESRRGPLIVDYQGKHTRPEAVPRGLDVPAILRRCWGISGDVPAGGVLAKK